MLVPNPGFWTHIADSPLGPCCDNVEMGEQIETIAETAIPLMRELVSASRVIRHGAPTEEDHFFFIHACENAAEFLHEIDGTKPAPEEDEKA